MELLWDKAPQTIMQLTNSLKTTEKWSKNIVITYLKRLEEKGAVSYERNDKAKLYFPIITQDDAKSVEVNALLNKVFNGNAGLLINTMVKEEILTKEELDQMYKFLHGEKDD